MRPYEATEVNSRHYPVGQAYELKLLGKQPRLHTLLFQEQDNNVSACATTARWMGFSFFPALPGHLTSLPVAHNGESHRHSNTTCKY